MNLEPLTRDLKRIALGKYQYTGPDLVVSGQWQARIYVLASDIDQTEFSATVTI